MTITFHKTPVTFDAAQRNDANYFPTIMPPEPPSSLSILWLPAPFLFFHSLLLDSRRFLPSPTSSPSSLLLPTCSPPSPSLPHPHLFTSLLPSSRFLSPTRLPLPYFVSRILPTPSLPSPPLPIFNLPPSLFPSLSPLSPLPLTSTPVHFLLPPIFIDCHFPLLFLTSPLIFRRPTYLDPLISSAPTSVFPFPLSSPFPPFL